MARQTLYTADEFLTLSLEGSYELVRGELVEMPPAGRPHGRITMRLGKLVAIFVETHHLGEVYAAETGFWIARDPDTVRAPDVSFVRNESLVDVPDRGFLTVSPDLIVEVASPDQSASFMQDKVEDWLQAGARLVWIVYPERRSLAVYTPSGGYRFLREGDTLDGGDVLPGFFCSVKEIFA